MHTKKYTALTIDTNIFDKHGLKLERGVLDALKQFKELPINFILSDVVEREVIAHLNKKEIEVVGKIKSATKEDDLINYLGCNYKVLRYKDKLFSFYDESDLFTNKLWKNFVDRCDITIIKSEENVSIGELLDLYFYCRSPFSESGKKKNEFPDAIALLALKKWAIRNDQIIMAVSNDEDWKKFAESEDWIEVVDDLGAAIENLRSYSDNSLQHLVNRIRDDLLKNSQSFLLENIKCDIESKLYISEIYADSPYLYEVDDEMLQVNEVRDISNIRLINSDLESVTIAFDCIIDYAAEASFCFYVKDPVDKDYVGLGTNHKSIEDSFEEEVVVTLAGNIINGLESMDVDDVEISRNAVDIDMGEVSPFEDYYEGDY